MSLTVAIIGSGPAAFYAAESLAQKRDDVQIDIIEKLPCPYGLIRGGVAPDHQTTKGITRKFEKTAMRDQVCYYGNVEIGRDINLTEIRDMYDAVVLAIGAPGDNQLDIPGIEKHGVYGSAAFVGWYNAHTDFTELEPDLHTETAVVIGLGNVALDTARILVRSRKEMGETDLPDYAVDNIQSAPLKNVYVAGRRGPEAIKFTLVELRELAGLDNAIATVRAEQVSDIDLCLVPENEQRKLGRSLDILKSYSTNKASDKDKNIHFEFYASPVEILGDKQVEGIRFERTSFEGGKLKATGETFDIPCGIVIFATGYHGTPIEGAPFDNNKGIIPNEHGRVEKGLYVAGWIKRGPVGVISSNKPDVESFGPGAPSLSRPTGA